jgi:beta-glucosidase
LGNPVNPQGFTSKYLDVDFTPEYPFGFGLSYTTLEYSTPRISSAILTRGSSVTVSADITNTGKREAEEVAQLYVRDLVASVAQPVRQLKGFRRVRLKPGEKRTVSFALSESDLSFYNESMQLLTEAGEFQVWISPDAARGSDVRFSFQASPH